MLQGWPRVNNTEISTSTSSAVVLLVVGEAIRAASVTRSMGRLRCSLGTDARDPTIAQSGQPQIVQFQDVAAWTGRLRPHPLILRTIHPFLSLRRHTTRSSVSWPRHGWPRQRHAENCLRRAVLLPPGFTKPIRSFFTIVHTLPANVSSDPRPPSMSLTPHTRTPSRPLLAGHLPLVLLQLQLHLLHLILPRRIRNAGVGIGHK